MKRLFRLSFQSFTIYHSSSSWLLPSSSHFAFFFIWTICALHNDTIPSIFSILLYFSLLKDKLNRTSNIPKYELNCDNKKEPTNNYVKLHWKGRRTCRERKCNKIFKNNFFSSCFFSSSLLALPFGFSFSNYRCSYELNNYIREATKRNWFWSMRLYSLNPCSLQTLNENFVEKKLYFNHDMALLNAQLQWSFHVLLLLFFLFFQILFFFSLKWTRYCSHAILYCWNLNSTITWKNVDNYSKNVLIFSERSRL